MKHMLKINAFVLMAMAAAFLVVEFVALANGVSSGTISSVVIAILTASAMLEADRRISALESQPLGSNPGND